jgi:molybdopterin-guanine dinucleotide biosynthesis protein A
MDTGAYKHITGMVLAGGQGSRLNRRDKGLVELLGRPMIEHVLAALEPQVGSVLINANRNTERYACYGFEVIPDHHSGYQGPLAGIASGLQHARSDYLLCVPCDSPLLATDLGDRLQRACIQSDAQIAIPDDGRKTHPVFALIDCSLRDSLENYLLAGDRKIIHWMSGHRMVTVDFSDTAESFLNINTESDLAATEQLMKHKELNS